MNNGDAKTRIREGLTALFRQINGNNNAFSAEVTEVDVNTRSCTVIGISDQVGVEYKDVWLMPEINDGILYVPAIGSTVIVENNANLQPYIVMWSEIDKILWVGGGSAIQIDKDGIKLDGDSFEGIMKVTPSVQAWNDLQNDINQLKQLFTTICATPLVTTSVGSPDAFYTAFNSAMTTWNASTLTVTSKSDIENTKVKHGDKP